MPVQHEWDKYEAAFLLNEIVYNRAKTSYDFNRISDVLRQYGKSRHRIVDSQYRNPAGIKLQTMAMKEAYNPGSNPSRKPNKTFCDVVYIYKTDINKFNELLSTFNNLC